MRTVLQRRIIVIAVLAIALGAPGIAMSADEADARQHAHVHGTAKLGVAIDGDVLTLVFESPLDSLIGFEHRPNTAAERAAVEALQTRMRMPDGLFRPTPAARCAITRAEPASALFEPPRALASDEHADLDASFEYRCEQIGKLTAIETQLFVAYPRLGKVDVEAVTPKGQFKRELKRPARTIPLER